MENLTLDSTLSLSPTQLSTDVGDESVILDLEAGSYYSLSGVGSRVWVLLRESRTVEQIRDVLLAEYEVDAERCESDLLALLEQLRAKGMIVVEPSPGEDVGA
jgi:hypothetical protein